MKRFKKPKTGTVTLSSKDIQKMKMEITESAVGTASLLYLTSMVDEFKMDYEDVKKVFVRATRYARYLDEHLATMKDLANSLEKDTGIKINWRHL